MNTNYTDKVIEHFTNPRNVGEIKNPDGVGEVGNPMCGDVMKLTIKVSTDDKGRQIVDDIKFKTFGCAAAIATSSITTDMAKGKTLDEAMDITRGDVVHALGDLPPIKKHCSNLAADALHEAIEDYKSKNSNNKI
jgi:nitrogen fixation protein NifU and related proteins